MKKGIWIILMLTAIVVSMSALVAFVHGFTQPIIDERIATEIEEALKEVYPEIVGSGYTTEESTLDFGITGISSALEVKDGDTVKAVIYTVTFSGYNPGVQYLIAVDSSGTITGFKIISQSETSGFGAAIAEPVRWEQFTGMLLQTAGEGNFDGIAGASFTTGGWKASMAGLYTFHKENYPVPELTDEEIFQLKILDFVGTSNTITELEPTGVKTLEEYEIERAFVVNDGTEDTQVVYYNIFFGAYGDVEILLSVDITDHTVTGFEALSSGDTGGVEGETMFGYAIMEEDRWTQFAGKSQSDLVEGNFDGIAGSTITTTAWAKALQDISIFHQAEYLGIVSLTPEQQFEAHKQSLFAPNSTFTDVTGTKPSHININSIEDVTDGSGTYLGTVYYVTTLGASYSSPTYIQFLVGIDADNEFTDMIVTKTTDTEDKVAGFFDGTYDANVTGVDIASDFAIDTLAGATVTSDIIQLVMEEIARFHIEDYAERPDNIEVDNAELLAAYPTATSFESVYEDYDFQEGIFNIYAAKDATEAVIGYVYYGNTAKGWQDTFEFTWGVDTSGVTQELNVFVGDDGWQAADDSEYSDYEGAYGGDFPTSTWIDVWEGIQIGSILTSPIDDVSGVSMTTGAVIPALEAIAQYHSDQSVGGAS